MMGNPPSSPAANRNLADYYHWEETDRGIRIYMHAAMVDRLQAEVSRGAQSPPPGGSEVGGILLGRVEEERGKAVVFIDDFVPVPCAHRAGSHYDLSAEDTLKLESALLRTALAACESNHAPSAIGFYRSHLREGLSLSASDLQTIDSYFQARSNVFLVVKTVAGAKACTAGFFFWEDDRIQSEFSSLEVALGSTSVPPAPAAQPDPPAPSAAADFPPELQLPELQLNDDLPADLAELFRSPAPPEPPAAPAVKPMPSWTTPVPAAPAPAPPAKTPRKTPGVWPGLLLRAATILIATVALVISALTYLGAPRPTREQAAAPVPAASLLGLQVERNSPDLLVTWNRSARDVAAANRATLTIRDGRVEKTLDLRPEDLARGSYLYAPAGDDIQLRLEVYGEDGGSVAQSIRVLLPSAKP